MDSPLITKWVQDVNELFKFEDKLDLNFLKIVGKVDPSLIIERLSMSLYDVSDPCVQKVYMFETFAMNYKALAKQYTEVIKPALPKAWMGASKEESVFYPKGSWLMGQPSPFIEDVTLHYKEFGELELAFMNLAAKKVFFDKVVKAFKLIWANDKEKWTPKEFVQNTWMELNVV